MKIIKNQKENLKKQRNDFVDSISSNLYNDTRRYTEMQKEETIRQQVRLSQYEWDLLKKHYNKSVSNILRQEILRDYYRENIKIIVDYAKSKGYTIGSMPLKDNLYAFKEDKSIQLTLFYYGCCHGILTPEEFDEKEEESGL